MWAILLIVWIVGVPVAYVAISRHDASWMRRWQWTEEEIAIYRASTKECLLLSMGSWWMVIAAVKFEVEDMRRRAKYEEVQRDLEELRQHIERMNWK
jgi:hypothetical protein